MAKKGRPVITIDWSKLDMALSLGATTKMAADYLEVSVSFLEKLITKEKGMPLGEYREQKMASTRLKLIQKALSKAFDGDNTMIIFALKNLCGWTDRTEHSFDKDKRTILLKYNLDESDQPKDVTPNDNPTDRE
jgi:hypothetical protein